jgi:hypothetical protein
MSHSLEPTLDPDTLQSALEASCDALMTLQSIEHGAREDEEPCAARRHVVQAIDSLRFAIDELRLAREEDASIVGHGFVVRADPVTGARGPGADGQVRPRRTA